MSARYQYSILGLLAACLTAATALSSHAEAAGPRRPVDTFTAVTANMTPAGLLLRMQVIEWQNEGARAEAVATLAAGQEATTPLGKLPTVGYVWPNGSPVGYSVKYAHREASPDGGERITLVTDRRLGSYDFKGWSVASPAVSNDHQYSVIELTLNGSGTGTGTMSLSGDVTLDEAAGTVALDAGGQVSMLLTDVKREPAAR
jgi:hypothetical protein